MRRSLRAVIAMTAILASTRQVVGESSCLYIDAQGVISQARSIANVPSEFRARAVCKDIAPDEIAVPTDLKLGNDSRSATFGTELGPVTMRWTRAVERCFTSTPSRAVGEAIKAVNRTLKSGRFTADIKRARREWSLAFTDKATAFAQFPVALTIGRHPGFMIPPSQIYIITDFIAPDCAASKVADELLAQVLLHEMGHVIEYLLLGESQTLHDRERSEGFATWFEQYASDYSSVIPKESVKRYYGELARESLGFGSGAFQGTPQDYARAALPFQAVVKKKGLATLMDVYKRIRDERLPWTEAIMRATGWSRATLERETRAVVGTD
jgi:hypothetical protein